LSLGVDKIRLTGGERAAAPPRRAGARADEHGQAQVEGSVQLTTNGVLGFLADRRTR
jgi:molybdenum cofactor biosynthesis enzyme MoaA